MGFWDCFLYLWDLPNHLELEYNYNILLFNPGLLLLSVFLPRDNSRWIYKTGYLIYSLLSILLTFN
jgi:hypothetical protein